MKIKVMKTIYKSMGSGPLLVGISHPSGYKFMCSTIDNIYNNIEYLKQSPDNGWSESSLTRKEKRLFDAAPSISIEKLRTILTLNPNYFEDILDESKDCYIST